MKFIAINVKTSHSLLPKSYQPCKSFGVNKRETGRIYESTKAHFPIYIHCRTTGDREFIQIYSARTPFIKSGQAVILSFP